MKRLLFIIIFAFSLNASFAQTMVVKKADGSYEEITITDAVEFSFYLPCTGTPTVDYLGQTYNTVQIGDQCWLKENLNVGNMINSYNGGTNMDGEQTDNSTLEKYCYNNTLANCNTYGGLYQWDEAMQYVTTEGTQGICPTGWHIPTLAQLTTLKATVSDDGNALKATGQGSGSGAGINISGFSALLAGYLDGSNGNSTSLSYITYLWSSTVSGSDANILSLTSSASGIFIYASYKNYGYSVRCLKD